MVFREVIFLFDIKDTLGKHIEFSPPEIMQMHKKITDKVLKIRGLDKMLPRRIEQAMHEEQHL